MFAAPDPPGPKKVSGGSPWHRLSAQARLQRSLWDPMWLANTSSGPPHDHQKVDRSEKGNC